MNCIHRTLAIAAATLGGAAAVVGARPMISPSQLAAEIDKQDDHISAVDLAELIMKSDQTLRIFDLRSKMEFDNFHIPGATLATLSRLANESLPHDSTIVLYSTGGAHAAQAWVLLRMRGYRNVYFMREGVYEWMARVSWPRLAIDATSKETIEFERAKVLSRFFGGTPMTDVPRTSIPQGYWTGAPNDGALDSAGAVEQTTKVIRRRGC
jgi:rhodanese-related sulfurtransferase